MPLYPENREFQWKAVFINGTVLTEFSNSGSKDDNFKTPVSFNKNSGLCKFGFTRNDIYFYIDEYGIIHTPILDTNDTQDFKFIIKTDTESVPLFNRDNVKIFQRKGMTIELVPNSSPKIVKYIFGYTSKIKINNLDIEPTVTMSINIGKLTTFAYQISIHSKKGILKAELQRISNGVCTHVEPVEIYDP